MDNGTETKQFSFFGNKCTFERRKIKNVFQRGRDRESGEVGHVNFWFLIERKRVIFLSNIFEFIVLERYTLIIFSESAIERKM